MAVKEPIKVLVSTTEVISYDATADFTTEIIEWSDFKGYSLNVWFSVFNGGNPSITFESSNSSDLLSFTPYENIENVSLPELFEDSYFTPKYIRFVYDASNVVAGSLVTFTLLKNTK